MGDLLSLSVILLSLLSFVTSLLTIAIRVGFSQAHLFAAANALSSESAHHHQIQESHGQNAMVQVDKFWQWSASLGLPFSSSNGVAGLGDTVMGMGYTGGAQLVRMNMNWQTPRKFGLEKPPQPLYDVKAPLSMAKLIISRQVSNGDLTGYLDDSLGCPNNHDIHA